MRHTTRYLEDMPSVIERLLDETPGDADEGDAWAAEIEPRRAEMASSAVRGLPVDEALRAIRGEPARDPR